MPLHLVTYVNGERYQWPLDGVRMFIGRGSGNEVRLLHPSVSRTHAELRQRDGNWSILDQGSFRGTSVNGREADSALPITTDDVIKVGDVALLVRDGVVIGGATPDTSEEERTVVASERAAAARIVWNLMPQAPDLPGWGIHARIETCPDVGGALYDFHVRADGRVVLLVGDVSGKGMGAALLMSSTLSGARALYDACDGPLDLVNRLNPYLLRGADARRFVTLFVGWLEPPNGRLRYVNAAHPAHVLHRGSVRTLGATGIPLGLLPDFAWTEGETVLDRGEMLALISDGMCDLEVGGEYFGDGRLAASLHEAEAAPTLEAAAARIIADVDAFAAGRPREDDIALVLLKRA